MPGFLEDELTWVSGLMKCRADALALYLRVEESARVLQGVWTTVQS